MRVTNAATDSVLDNDVEFFSDAGQFTISQINGAAFTPGTAVDIGNGVLTMNANGTFSFAPDAGFTGTQTFTYTLRDAGLDDVAGNADDLTGTGTVTINVNAPKVWYVDNSYAGANGASDGTALRPFTSLNALNGGTGDGSANDDVDGANDLIYVKGAGRLHLWHRARGRPAADRQRRGSRGQRRGARSGRQYHRFDHQSAGRRQRHCRRHRR